MKIHQILSMFTALILISCSELPALQNLDLEKWKADSDACTEYRITVVDGLLAQKTKLRGLSQNEMISLLGVADKHQLYERSQKFFIYYLEPNQNCDSFIEGYRQALYIRFNSLDQAVEFNVQKVK